MNALISSSLTLVLLFSHAWSHAETTEQVVVNKVATSSPLQAEPLAQTTEALEEAVVTADLVPFSAEYASEWKLGWFSVDVTAKRSLVKKPNGHWYFSFDADTRAAALQETSEFVVNQGQIQPLFYRYRASGLFNEDDRTLDFAPADKKVHDREKMKVYSQAWSNSVQDNQTYMLQAALDLGQGQQALSYEVFEKKRSKPFNFRVIGEEVLETPAGRFNAVKVQQIRKDKNREIFAWFAKDKHYVLLKLVDRKKGKKRYEINITKLTF